MKVCCNLSGVNQMREIWSGKGCLRKLENQGDCRSTPSNFCIIGMMSALSRLSATGAIRQIALSLPVHFMCQNWIFDS